MLFPWATYDLGDILAYATGAIVSCLWWNREALTGWLRRDRQPLGIRRDLSVCQSFALDESFLDGHVS